MFVSLRVCTCLYVCPCVCARAHVHGYLSLLQRSHRIYMEYRYMKASNKALVLLDFETRKKMESRELKRGAPLKGRGSD